MEGSIVIGMPLKNGETTVEKSIQSVLDQTGVKRKLKLLIACDQPEDASSKIIQSFLPDSRIEVLEVSFGFVSKTRNFITQFIRENFKDCILVGRLDADDTLIDNVVISRIESIWEKYQFDVLFAGNRQAKNGNVIEFINQADKRFFDFNYMAERLKQMSEGVKKAELPSCNIFFSPSIQIDYPLIQSAEDHWFSILLLTAIHPSQIHIAEDLLYCNYSLDGNETQSNKQKEVYLQSRKELYQYYLNLKNNG